MRYLFFFNSIENRGVMIGQPKALSIYDVQHLIYRHIGEFNGRDKYAISSRLKRFLTQTVNTKKNEKVNEK